MSLNMGSSPMHVLLTRNPNTIMPVKMPLRVLCAAALYSLTPSPWTIAEASTTTAPPVSPHEKVFYPEEASSSLSTLLTPDEKYAPEVDTAWIWQRYESHLLSKTRSAAFFVLFTSGEDCEAIVEDAVDEEEPATELQIQERVQQCLQQREHGELVVNATQTAWSEQRGLLTAPVVRISKTLLPQAFEYHRISSSSSLLWLPPRSSNTFQRYPHPQTNFLDLSSSSSDVDVFAAITAFFQRHAKQNALLATTPPLAFEGSTAESVINTLPFLAIGLYLVLLAFEHRVKVLKVVESRVTWLVITEGIVYVSLSGLFHSIIHKMPPLVLHPQYGLYLLHPSGRKQFFLEGLVMGSWSFWVSLGLFSIVDVLPKVRSAEMRDDIFQYALLCIGFPYIVLHMIFTAKHPWLSR